MKRGLPYLGVVLWITFAVSCFIVGQEGSAEPPLINAGLSASCAYRRSEAPKFRQETTPVQQAAMTTAAQRLRGGIVSLWDHEGGWATGFVISRRHRLVATPAHVADYAFQGGTMQAVLDGTTMAYPVVRRWYHPRLLRKLDDGLYARSDDPKDGEIQYPTCDLAVLQLSDAGQELPVELHLAEDEELRALEGQSVGLLSHSGSVAPVWSTAGQLVSARFSSSIVRPPINKFERTDSRYNEFIYLDYDSSVRPADLLSS